MLAEKNEDIRKAYDLLQVMSKDEKSRMAYEAREAEIHDQMTRIKTAREEGANDKALKRFVENVVKSQNKFHINYYFKLNIHNNKII